MVALRSDSVNRNSKDQTMREHFQLAFLKYSIKPQATGTLPLTGPGADPRGFHCRLTFCQVILFFTSDFTE